MTRAQRIEKSLVEQIKLKGADQYHFRKLIEDYCVMFEIKEQLAAEIKEKGVTVEYTTSKGYQAEKNNPAIAELLRINAQMLKILTMLEISPAESMKEDGTVEL